MGMKNDKYETLCGILRDMGSVAVCFSGGVDSTFLLTVANEVLGDRCTGVICLDASVPEREVDAARKYCDERGISLVSTRIDPMQQENYRKNTKDRCYYCKFSIMSEVQRIADELGLEYLAEGSNVDDEGDYRPGLRALEELGVRSPLREAGLTKADIRELSREMDIPTWDKPSFACLASRIPYGEEITTEKLTRIDRSEQVLSDLGFRQFRVRSHGNIARIEVPAEDIEKAAAPEVRSRIVKELKQAGFDYVTLDLGGFRSGSMNIGIVKAEEPRHSSDVSDMTEE